MNEAYCIVQHKQNADRKGEHDTWKKQGRKRWIRAENGKVSYVLEYEDGHKVQVPINSDGSIKWHEDIGRK